MTWYKPELLAPAGDMQAALTAYEYGADAVYAGLQNFNARERTENFSVEDLERLTGYAHQQGRKLYVTMNTLIKQSELRPAMETLVDIARINPDAVIIQDLGVLQMIKRYFPELTVHASTQMGIHNSPGLQCAAGNGIERVILERQVTLDEIKEMSAKSSVELEVFVHGALCCCLSGSCLFSSWQGGWSGNRGKCKQPCRRRFFGDDGNGFFFSTRDLYGLDQITALSDMGVASLKIEGRLRKADYVRNVVSAYRMILDTPPKERQQVLPEARSMLADSLGRKWSSGFLTKQSLNDLIEHDSMGVAGLLCGIVSDRQPNGFAARLSRTIKIGDSVRVQPRSGDEGPALVISRMRVKGKLAKKAAKGQECFIYCDKEIPDNSRLFKISGKQGKRVKVDLPDADSRLALDLDIQVSHGHIKVACVNLEDTVTWESDLESQPAKKRPLEAETVAEAFRATRSDKYKAGRVSVEIDGDLFVPASVLKAVRRDGWEYLEQTIQEDAVFDHTGDILAQFVDDLSQVAEKEIPPSEQDTYLLKPKTKSPERRAIQACPVADCGKKTEEVVLPYFCPEGQVKGLERQIADAYANKVRRFRVTSLFGLELLRDYEDITIIASYPLPVANSLAADQLEAAGVSRVQAWIELEKNELVSLNQSSPLVVEIYKHGRPPILSTRARIPTQGKISDSRGNVFIVKYHSQLGMTCVYPEAVMDIPELQGMLNFYDLTNARYRESLQSSFNFEHSLV